MVNLSRNIQRGLQNERISQLVERILKEDFFTFKVPKAETLARKTISDLVTAGSQYPEAARSLALEVYPTWHGKNVRELYHAYNWSVERAGSAETATPFIRGNSLLDLGGGPGTFSLELLKKRSSDLLKITVADLEDYRNREAKAHPQISFHPLKSGSDLPFANDSFDSLSLLYVLHHVETDHDLFLKECARCVRKALLLFEDVKVDLENGIPERVYRPARKLEQDFLALSLDEQEQFIAVVDYICNHIASQALTMPVPGKYYEFSDLGNKLQNLFPEAKVTKRFHGIYDTKCYPNPEALYVVEWESK